MQGRPLVYIGLFVGSTIGSFIPDLWGAGMFSISSIFFGWVGACAGIYIGYRLSEF